MSTGAAAGRWACVGRRREPDPSLLLCGMCALNNKLNIWLFETQARPPPSPPPSLYVNPGLMGPRLAEPAGPASSRNAGRVSGAHSKNPTWASTCRPPSVRGSARPGRGQMGTRLGSCQGGEPAVRGGPAGPSGAGVGRRAPGSRGRARTGPGTWTIAGAESWGKACLAPVRLPAPGSLTEQPASILRLKKEMLQFAK